LGRSEAAGASLSNHLERTREAVRSYLEWRDRAAKEYIVALSGKEPSLEDLQDILDAKENPQEKPEILDIVERTELLGVPFYEGGWSNWPWIFCQEVAICLTVRQNYHSETELNDLLRDSYQAKVGLEDG